MNANKLAEKSKNLLEKYTLEGYASKRVSFIVATRNRAEYLMQALERSRTLVTPEDELIIIDGGSTDNTAEVVRKYSDIVDIFISEPDKGPGHAFSKGMLLARGKYLKQLPDDDIVHPSAMEQSIRVMEEHPEIDLLVCGGTREIGGKVKPVWLPPGTNYGYSPRDIF
ncbi:MAG: glycosyltransferase, partial [Dehalococcoidales bacterium]|nr:glycosyltransferase [Dehalococcoidales bacterium]